MCVQNVKFAALPIPEIIIGVLKKSKNWVIPIQSWCVFWDTV